MSKPSQEYKECLTTKIAALLDIVQELKLKPELLHLFGIDVGQFEDFTTVNHECKSFLQSFDTSPKISDNSGQILNKGNPLLLSSDLWSEDMLLLQSTLATVVSKELTLSLTNDQLEIADLASTPQISSDFEPLLSSNRRTLCSTDDICFVPLPTSDSNRSEPFSTLNSDPSIKN